MTLSAECCHHTDPQYVFRSHTKMSSGPLLSWSSPEYPPFPSFSAHHLIALTKSQWDNRKMKVMAPFTPSWLFGDLPNGPKRDILPIRCRYYHQVCSGSRDDGCLKRQFGFLCVCVFYFFYIHIFQIFSVGRRSSKEIVLFRGSFRRLIILIKIQATKVKRKKFTENWQLARSLIHWHNYNKIQNIFNPTVVGKKALLNAWASFISLFYFGSLATPTWTLFPDAAGSKLQTNSALVRHQTAHKVGR